MPRIIVQAEEHEGEPTAVLLKERVSADDLLSDHFSAQLMERLGWAILDAEDSERRAA